MIITIVTIERLRAFRRTNQREEYTVMMVVMMMMMIMNILHSAAPTNAKSTR